MIRTPSFSQPVLIGKPFVTIVQTVKFPIPTALHIHPFWTLIGPCKICGRRLYRATSTMHHYGTEGCVCTPCIPIARNSRKKAERQAARGTVICVCCGNSFIPTRTDATTCSNACRQKQFRHRRKENDKRADEYVEQQLHNSKILNSCSRHRTVRSKGCLSNKTALALIFKLAEAAEKSWRRLDGHNQLPKVILGVKFADGVEVIRSQAQAAAA